jgi:hypothetical protein
MFAGERTAKRVLHGEYGIDLDLRTFCDTRLSEFSPSPPPGGAGADGDPHFKTWRGKRFDFHGECDLVLVHSPVFESGLGLDVHIRTKLRRDMSYISSAALKIGSDLLEVESQGVYYLNGELGAELPDAFSGFAFSYTHTTDKHPTDKQQLVFEVEKFSHTHATDKEDVFEMDDFSRSASSYSLDKEHVFKVDDFSRFASSNTQSTEATESTQPTDKQHVFEVYLGGRERIKIKTYKDFVSVLIEQGKSEHFLHSVGLMGDFRNGDKIARDVKTVLDDANAFGQEWQVLDTEPSLFHALRLPQHPQKCIMPTPAQVSQLRRRLAETSSADELAAEKVCAHWGEGKDDCIFDVLTTGDLEMAVMGAY